MIENAVLLGGLAVLAYRDWKEKQIYIYIPFLLGIVGLTLHLFLHKNSMADILAGIGVGAVFILISWIGKGCIGAGDGTVLMATGIFLGFWGNLQLIFVAFLLAAVAAVILLITKRKGRKDSMPFIPFLFLAYLLCLI